ncbi:hypothetical protein PHYBOEH_003648 [Phytophthora boehmeriae]|uniref:Amino acid transporter transmembrane domain-containing protein n=1 Tax=Phytophthora boehmeriae TaxID=109152 RepID=A0A8T1WT88_9STRA|nr:hypothetical protein PHYBOEH_003648 [Phytophthora boehmeriae]
MLASPILSLASSTRSLPSRLPQATSSRRTTARTQPQASARARFGSLHVYMGFLMSIIGSGMLSVPYTLVLIPKWQALAGIAFVGGSMACTANALLHAHVHAAAREEFEARMLGAGSKFVGFQALARRAGGPALGYAVSVVAASGVYGGCVGNIQIIRDLTPFVVRLVYGGFADLSASEQDTVTYIVMWSLLAVVLLPLCMFRKLSALQPTNYVSFVLALYLVGAVVYRSFQGYEPVIDAETFSSNGTGGLMSAGSMSANETFDGSSSGNGTTGFNEIGLPNTKVSTITPTETSTLNGNSFTQLAQSISIYNFAFMMTLNLLPLFVQLLGVNSEDKSSRGGASTRSFVSLVSAPPLLTARLQMTRCIFGASLTCAVLYGALGCAAFGLYSTSIDGNILLNLQNDPVMKVPLLAMYVTVLFTFPLLFLPLRSLVEELLSQSIQSKHDSTGHDIECGHYSAESISSDDFSKNSRFGRFIVVLVLLCSQQLIALTVSGIEVVFSLMGATSCLVICYVFPVVAFTMLYPWRRARRGVLWLSFLWIIVGIVTIQGFTCVWLLLTSQ